MAFTAPTATDLKTRYPTFASVADATVDLALADAALLVDDSWCSQEDFTRGRLLYAAHLLTLEGNDSSGAGLGAYRKIKSDGLELERDSDAAVQPGALQSTTFGVQFEELQERNVGTPFLVQPGAA